jgi:Tfp pilus assembly protein PilF
MKKGKLSVLVATIVFAALGGCSPRPWHELQAKLEALLLPKAQSLMAAGIEQYEQGDYADAAASLQRALDHGLPLAQRVSAHKHLAFIYCTSDLEPACRMHFRKALIADPAMGLDAAEAGHPTWGPVFERVRAGD